jgi:hypothetical protein
VAEPSRQLAIFYISRRIKGFQRLFGHHGSFRAPPGVTSSREPGRTYWRSTMVALSEDKSANPAAFRVKTKLDGALHIFCGADDLVVGDFQYS